MVEVSHLLDSVASESAMPNRRSVLVRRSRSLAICIRDRAEANVFSAVVGVRTAGRVLALTYDDGPTPGVTEHVGSHLTVHGHFATFFVMLPRAQENPSLVNELLAQGHQIGLHGLDHVRLSGLGSRELFRTLRESRAALEDLTGEPVRLIRPPYGAQSRLSYLVARAAGLEPVGWSIDPVDYRPGSLVQVSERLPRTPNPGSIVLLHDGDGEGNDGPLGDDYSRFKRDFATHTTNWLAQTGMRSLTLDSMMHQFPAVTARWVRGNG